MKEAESKTPRRGRPAGKPNRTLLDRIHAHFPSLPDALASSPLMKREQLQAALTPLLTAHAPSTGCALPGGIIDQLRATASTLDLPPLLTAFGLGNATMSISEGAPIGLMMDASAPDLLLTAHMDRPTFKVRNAERGDIYPICAVRFPKREDGIYRAPAKAMRFKSGKLTVGAQGMLIYRREWDEDILRFEVTEGRQKLEPFDLITLDVQPTYTDDQVRGTGLDNSLGVLTLMGVAGIFAQMADLDTRSQADSYSLVFAFTDEEEGDPTAFFGRGAARLPMLYPPPDVGMISVDAQSENADSPRIGRGGSYGHISAWGRGAIAPPNAVALANDLAEALEKQQPNTMQMNTGYLSRSDDMALTRWARVMGMFGPPMRNAHTAEEEASLSDVQAAITGLSYFVAALITPDITKRYHLIEQMPFSWQY